MFSAVGKALNYILNSNKADETGDHTGIINALFNILQTPPHTHKFKACGLCRQQMKIGS